VRKRRRRRISFCTYIEVGGGGRREGWSTPRDEELKNPQADRERESKRERRRGVAAQCVYFV